MKQINMLLTPTSLIVFAIVLFVVVIVVMVGVLGKRKPKNGQGAGTPSVSIPKPKQSIFRSVFYSIFGAPKIKPVIPTVQPVQQQTAAPIIPVPQAVVATPVVTSKSKSKKGATKAVATGVTTAVVIPTEPEEPKTGGFSAMIFTKDKGIVFLKIAQLTGNPIELDPSMPQHGGHDLVVKVLNKNKTQYIYEHYDPRHEPFNANETPEKAYYAIDSGKRVYKRVYANKYEAWDKINLLLAGVALVGLIMVVLALIDKLT